MNVLGFGGLRQVRCALAVAALVSVAGAAGAQDWAKAALEKSPRHREYVPITHDGRTVNTLVVYPEVKGKAPVVVLIHEIFGESDWFKLMADEVAAKGYIAVAPDLVSGVGPGDGGTDALTAQGGQDAVIKAVMGLPADQVNADLDAVADYAEKLPAARAGKLFVAGFCWGGGKSFAYATHRADLTKAFVFYGPPPKTDAMASIHAPVYGFYAENDARITATVPQATADMKAAGKTYEPVVYAGAGHGFMRAGQAPPTAPAASMGGPGAPPDPKTYAANKKAWEEGWARWLKEMKDAK